MGIRTCRVSPMRWVALAAMVVLAPGAIAADFVMMTAPAQPIAGQPWSIVFAAQTLQGRDLNPATGPEVTVLGDRIRIRPRAECNEPTCDVLVKSIIRADVPPLPPGQYTVEVVSVEFMDFAFAAPFSVEVKTAEPKQRVRAVDGFWSQPGKPGRGLSLQTRGETMGIALYDSRAVFQQFEPIWHLDAPVIRGDTVVVAPRRQRSQLADPACLGCVQSTEPEQLLATFPLRLRFESERRAWVDLADGRTIPIVSLPFGASYVPIALHDSVDSEFGLLPLPDLQGRWFFDLPGGGRVVELRAPQANGEQVEFQADSLSIRCSSASSTQRAGCALLGGSEAYFAMLGDTSEHRIRFRASNGLSFYAERMTMP